MSGAHRVPLHNCPACGHRLNAAGEWAGPAGRPDVGTMTVCIGCGSVLEFTLGLALRLLRQAELDDLDPDSRAALARLVMRVRAFAGRR